jgi:hypothetical protein
LQVQLRWMEEALCEYRPEQLSRTVFQWVSFERSSEDHLPG